MLISEKHCVKQLIDQLANCLSNFCFDCFQASLKAGIDLRDVVALPSDEDLNEWLAVHGIFS